MVGAADRWVSCRPSLHRRKKSATIPNHAVQTNLMQATAMACGKDPGMSLVDTELSAVRQGYDRGVVTWDEVCQRFDELERLLWCAVFRRLRRVEPYDPRRVEPQAGSPRQAGTAPAGGPAEPVPAG
jgi:hypothetical protein